MFNELGIKLLSNIYAVYQVVLIGSLVGMTTFLVLIMPLNGVTVFGTWPDALGLNGIALIFGAGLYLLWRETTKSHRTLEET